MDTPPIEFWEIQKWANGERFSPEALDIISHLGDQLWKNLLQRVISEVPNLDEELLHREVLATYDINRPLENPRVLRFGDSLPPLVDPIPAQQGLNSQKGELLVPKWEYQFRLAYPEIEEVTIERDYGTDVKFELGDLTEDEKKIFRKVVRLVQDYKIDYYSRTTERPPFGTIHSLYLYLVDSYTSMISVFIQTVYLNMDQEDTLIRDSDVIYSAYKFYSDFFDEVLPPGPLTDPNYINTVNTQAGYENYVLNLNLINESLPSSYVSPLPSYIQQVFYSLVSLLLPLPQNDQLLLLESIPVEEMYELKEDETPLTRIQLKLLNAIIQNLPQDTILTYTDLVQAILDNPYFDFNEYLTKSSL